MTNQGTPAGWYEDPARVGELRYYDGDQWTEHVTIDGVQTTAPLAADTPADAGTPTFTMTRVAQWRSEDEKPLDVVGRTGVMGRFTTQLDGAPGYRFDDVDGDTVVTISKPGLKSAIEVRDPAGYMIATITKIGRLHSRYDIVRTDTGEKSVVRLAGGAADEWELTAAGEPVATIVRTVSSAPDQLNFAAVSYAATISAALDEQAERVVLVVPLAIDILDTQALT